MGIIIKSIDDFFKNNSIELFAPIPFQATKIINENKYQRCKVQNPKTVIIFAVPYFTGKTIDTNISSYAHSRDYHVYFSHLFTQAKEYFEKVFSPYQFEGYADSGFIDERHAAAISGLGVLGTNKMIITKKYGSYVFLGEIITDMPTESFYENSVFDYPTEVKGCINCGICKKVCPVQKNECCDCLSSITQKKKELTKDEIVLMVKYNTVWGCDICQDNCPMNKNPQLTPIQFFYENKICKIDLKTIENMDDNEFKKRAFSWRGRKTILRNVEIYEKYPKEVLS